ncbi:MAG: glycosyltransferase family 1 protein [Gammaproteobacteria bacterium PRO9]|nr:glycosyltransferase family 1 protein [Gammaproteobacteria bacterium PRO9]
MSNPGNPVDRQAPRCRLLALAPNPWHGQWMNRQQILSRLAARHGVLYSTGPWTIWDRDSERFRSVPFGGRFTETDGVMVDESPRWLLRWPTVPAYDQAVQALVLRRWRRQLGRMGTGPLIAYLFHPAFLHLALALRADHLVYHPYDLFRSMPGWTAELAELEDRLLGIADAVIATSEPTRAALQPQSATKVHCVPNGVDRQLYLDRALKPVVDALSGIPRPRIGYVGSLNRKVDLALIAWLARREPDWHFPLIGPLGSFDAETAAALEELKQLPNVHLTGSRERGQLPDCITSLDVALMCYREGTWMDSAYPLKLHEYLASGPPVVSTSLPTVQPFSHVVATARNRTEWHALIGQALRDGTPGTPAERRAVAAANTWEHRVSDISAILATVVDRTATTGTLASVGMPSS